jgi:hypothetical protein
VIPLPGPPLAIFLNLTPTIESWFDIFDADAILRKKVRGAGCSDGLVVVGFFFFSTGGVVIVRVLGASLFGVDRVIVRLCIVV